LVFDFMTGPAATMRSAENAYRKEANEAGSRRLQMS